MLLKQIIYYKKQHKQIKEEHSRLKEEVEQNQKEEEQTDRMLASKLDKKGKATGDTVQMPTIMKGGKKMSDAQQPGSVFGMLNSSSKGFQPVPPSVTQMQS